MLDKVVAELIEGGYDKTTPVAIVVKASWPDQRIIRGHIGNYCGHRSERRRIAPSYDRSKPCIR